MADGGYGRRSGRYAHAPFLHGDGYRALQNRFGVETRTERSVASAGDWTETTTHPDLTRTWVGGKHTRYDYRQGLLVAKRHFTGASSDTGTNAGNDAQTPDVGQTYNNRGQLVNVITSYTTAHPGTRISYLYDAANFRVTRELQQLDPDLTFTLGATDTAISINTGISIPASISRYVHHKADSLLRSTGPDLRANSSPTSTLDIGSTLVYGSTDGRLLSVTGDYVGSTGTYTYAYQTNSNLIDTVTGPVHTVDNSWFSDRDALDWKQNKVGTATISKYDYGVNAIGQRDAVAATSTVGTFATAPDWNWAYNARGELVSSQHVNTAASSRHYTFDAIGNRSEHRNGTHTTTGGTATTYTPNALNQYSLISNPPISNVPSYDLDGNMTSGPLPAVPGANSTLTWDGENQLIEATPSGGSAVKYHYDALHRRVAQTIGSNRTYWFYDGWNLVAEFTGAVHTSGSAPVVTLEKTWLWGKDLSNSLQGAGGVGGLLAATLETGSYTGIYHPLYDGNGNIGQYLDASGTAVAKYEYDGFGNALVSTGTLANTLPHRFSTKPLDAETGLYYYAYRHYDPLTGRWPSRDPIGEKGGLNLHGFIGNNGVCKWDYLGLSVLGDLPPYDPLIVRETTPFCEIILNLERSNKKFDREEENRIRWEGSMPVRCQKALAEYAANKARIEEKRKTIEKSLEIIKRASRQTDKDVWEWMGCAVGGGLGLYGGGAGGCAATCFTYKRQCNVTSRIQENITVELSESFEVGRLKNEIQDLEKENEELENLLRLCKEGGYIE
jgi:RHS repeat-associated protein